MSKLKLNFLNKYNDPRSLDTSVLTILRVYANEIEDYSKEYLRTTLKTYSKNNIVNEIALFIVAREINYEYCALEVRLNDVDSIAVIFRTLITDQFEEKEVDISRNLNSFDETVQEFLSSTLFNDSLKFLVDQILMKRHSRQDIRNLIKVGEAKVLELKDGDRINAGFYKVDGDNVYYYTGKGLREMFKPQMTTAQKEKAKMLKQLNDEDLLDQGYLAIININDIENVI